MMRIKLNDRELDMVAGGRISKDEALTRVLVHAKVNKEDIHYKEVERSWDNGIQIYEISFVHNGIAYEYDVDAETGDILNADSDYWM